MWQREKNALQQALSLLTEKTNHTVFKSFRITGFLDFVHRPEF
jgi:hypothetical protein